MSCCPRGRGSASSSTLRRLSATGFADRGSGRANLSRGKKITNQFRGNHAWSAYRVGRRQRRRAVGFWAVAGSAFAQDTVKIGAIYPLSGNAASAGNYAKMAIELAADVVNNGNAELAKVAAARRAAAACRG